MHKTFPFIMEGNIEMETFATYIMEEKDWVKKLEIAYYLRKKANTFFLITLLFLRRCGQVISRSHRN